jgi:hypothetical protein
MLFEQRGTVGCREREQCRAVASTLALGVDQCAHSHMNVHVLVPDSSSSSKQLQCGCHAASAMIISHAAVI